jgi:hypothetical protein
MIDRDCVFTYMKPADVCVLSPAPLPVNPADFLAEILDIINGGLQSPFDLVVF